MRHPNATRLLIVPGLHDSGPAHWQTWLQGLHRHSLRVVQTDWQQPDLARWSETITRTLEHAGPGPWIAVGHSFGSLALVQHLAQVAASPIRAALLVAPADPARFGVAEQLSPLQVPVVSTVVASDTDPWMQADQARRWARRWGSHWINLGDAGHINTESGFGPLPLARRWVLAVEQRLARERRPAAASIQEWHFAT
jgi:predicted alpha/beta hydrolase family esterase